MNKSAKVFILIFIAVVGVLILTLIKESRGASMGFFGIFGVAMYMVYQSLFKSQKADDDNDDIVLKK